MENHGTQETIADSSTLAENCDVPPLPRTKDPTLGVGYHERWPGSKGMYARTWPLLKVTRTGLEPVTKGLRVPCSPN